MRSVLRKLLGAMTIASSSAVIAACSGGGGGTSSPQGPPPPPFAISVNSGLAIGLRFDDIAVVGGFALVPVSESETGADLNGDGDQFDSVAHLLDVKANVATNLRLAMRGKPVASDRQFAFLVAEPDQNSDVNGDGDMADAIWHLLDPALEVSSANPVNTGLATPLGGKPGIGADGGMLLIASESAMGADISGDGDTLDDVVFAVEHLGRSLVPLGIAPYATGTALVVRGHRILICSSEAAAGIDLTGDTDKNDIVLGAVTFDGPGPPSYTAIGGGAPSAIDPRSFALTEHMAVYLVSESASGARDLNGDGDTADSIISLTDIRTGIELFPTASSVSFLPLAANINTGFATSDDRVLFGIDENGQGKDLNIDQDTVDSILAWINVESTPSLVHVVGLTLGSQRPQVQGKIGLVSINEAASALVVGVDHNGDGDISDQVAFRVDLTTAPAVLRNLGLAVEGFSLNGADAVLVVSEAAQSGLDLNGDTDTNDLVPSYADLARVSPAFRSLGVSTHSHRLIRTGPDSVRIALLIPEQPLTARADLNGDGDSLDNAHFWIDLDPTTLPATVRPPTPHLIGIGAFSTAPPIIVDADTLLFATSEAMLDRDLNGDNDTDDTLLRIILRPVE